MNMRARGVHAWPRRAWTWLGRLGLTGLDRVQARYVMGANHMIVLSSGLTLGWAIGFWIHHAPHQWPAALPHTALIAVWAGCLWLNARGRHLTAVTIALIVPLAQYVALAWWYSREAGYQLVPLTLTAIAFVAIPPSVWALRAGFAVATCSVAAWISFDERFAVTHLEVPGLDLRWALAGNLLAAALLVTVPLAFSDYYLTRERRYADRLVEQAETAARTDTLTGVFNRRGLAPHFTRAVRDGEYAVALVDLDRFKFINDRLGHGAGDIVLERVARRLEQSIGDEGIVSRWGGEEFLVLMPGVTAQRSVRIIERARAALERESKQVDALGRVTFSAGVAHVPQGTSREEALRIADRLLYAAKDAGRNRVYATTVRGMRHLPVE